MSNDNIVDEIEVFYKNENDENIPNNMKFQFELNKTDIPYYKQVFLLI